MTAATFDRFQISRNELPLVFKRDIANISTNGNFGSNTPHELDTTNGISENVLGLKVGLHLPVIKVGKKMGSLKPDILSLEKERKRLGFVSRKKGPGFYETLDKVCEESSKPDTAEINRSIIDEKSIFVNNDACSEDDVMKDKSRGRPNMEHPTLVYGEITRPWTPVFALLEHKYIDKKDKTELGKPKRRGVLIPDGLTYGRPNATRDGGSSEALHGWPTLNSTSLPFARKEKQAQRDFMSLNKAAVSAGLVTAQDQYQFRATHDVRRKTQSEDNQRSRTRRMPPSMVYGISTRPSTPIFDLLEHKYQDKWLQQRRQLELAKRQEENKQKRSPGQVYETRASLLRTYQNPVDPAPLWQMPKFTNQAKPSLQTFRSARARQSAYDHFDSDKISRRGNLGHGVFEAAKN